uniref:Uncharacterized protein n=1 Tax=Arundo donax TaxID=35708 RepID=A0A0A8XU91_ARUDO
MVASLDLHLFGVACRPCCTFTLLYRNWQPELLVSNTSFSCPPPLLV